MVAAQGSGASAPRKPSDSDQDDVFGTITGLAPVLCRVRPELEIDAVALDLRMPGAGRPRGGRTHALVQLVLAPADAIALATRLAGAAERVRVERAYRGGQFPQGEEG